MPFAPRPRYLMSDTRYLMTAWTSFDRSNAKKLHVGLLGQHTLHPRKNLLPLLQDPTQLSHLVLDLHYFPPTVCSPVLYRPLNVISWRPSVLGVARVRGWVSTSSRSTDGQTEREVVA